MSQQTKTTPHVQGSHHGMKLKHMPNFVVAIFFCTPPVTTDKNRTQRLYMPLASQVLPKRVWLGKACSNAASAGVDGHHSVAPMCAFTWLPSLLHCSRNCGCWVTHLIQYAEADCSRWVDVLQAGQQVVLVRLHETKRTWVVGCKPRCH